MESIAPLASTLAPAPEAAFDAAFDATSAADSVADDAQEDGAALAEERQLAVPAAWHGQRLDRALAALAPEFSRSYALISRTGLGQIPSSRQTKSSIRPKKP